MALNSNSRKTFETCGYADQALNVGGQIENMLQTETQAVVVCSHPKPGVTSVSVERI